MHAFARVRRAELQHSVAVEFLIPASMAEVARAKGQAVNESEQDIHIIGADVTQRQDGVILHFSGYR